MSGMMNSARNWSIKETWKGKEHPTGTRKLIYDAEGWKDSQYKKQEYFNLIISEADKDFRENNHREAYTNMKFFMKYFQPTTSLYRSLTGEILADIRKVLLWWREFSEQLLNPSDDM